MDEFIFNYIFETSKDKEFINAIQFRHYLSSKYGINNKRLGTDLYIAINRYQVKKYGKSLNPMFVFYSKETEARIRANRNSIKQARKNRKGFWLNKTEVKK